MHQIQNTILDSGKDDEVIIISFKYEDDDICVIIQEPLHINSKIETVMEVGNVFDEFHLSNSDINNNQYRFIIKSKTGGGYRMKWYQIRDMTVKTFKCIRGLHDDFMIAIVKN